MHGAIPRRTLVFGAVAVGVGIAMPGARATQVGPSSGNSVGANSVSLNGWPVEKEANHVSAVCTRPVSGTGLTLEVRLGVVEAILVHVVRRIHYEVQPIMADELMGWQPISRLDRRRAESNRASGTAVHVRPGSPRDAYFPLQVLAVRDILADCEGVVRWGGDDKQVDQSLFYIDVPPSDRLIARVGLRLQGVIDSPATAAGVMVDFLEAPRVRRASDLGRRQAKT